MCVCLHMPVCEQWLLITFEALEEMPEYLIQLLIKLLIKIFIIA